LLSEFNKYFDRTSNDASSGATADWAPPVDIEEYADKFVIYADVPGIDPSTIEVTLEKGVLSLSGSRAQAVEQKGVEARRTERATGRFHRRFALPDTADADAVSASGKNGVLEVTIPKRPQVQPRKIAVTH
jgi:HSP20 family protein